MPLPPETPGRRRSRLSWRFLRALLNRAFARQLAGLALDGYLEETGWARSVREKAVVDSAGEPLPWATYPFIDFITPRLQKGWKLFEYGAGNSTLFYARRVAAVTAVEHDEEYARTLRPRLPANATLLVHPRGSAEYIGAIAELPSAPEIVSVDGRDRVRCAEAAHGRLGLGGVLVFDDTDRPEYLPAAEMLKAAGFRRLDFWGVSPGQPERRCTSVFYRTENILGV